MAKDIREALRDHLITKGQVRKPGVTGSLPPMWLEPRHGVPAPGEAYEGGSTVEIGTDAVLGVRLAGGIPQGPIVASTIRSSILDIWVRTTTAPEAATLADLIRAEINDKRDWTMGGLTIISSLIFKELQPVTSNDQAFTFLTSYVFEHYV